MISSSIWHCDYCLGDICCCIKSNLLFLSSIVTMPELFSFFQGGGDDPKEHPRKAAQPRLWLRNTRTRPCDGFCPLPDPWADRLPTFTAGAKLYLSLCAFACEGCGPSLYCRGAANSSHCPCDTWLQESLEQPPAGSLLLLLKCSFKIKRIPLICAGEKAFFRMTSSEGRWWL